MKILNAQKSFHLKVKTLYDIEKQLEIALPKMAEASTNAELEAGFLEHLEETKEQSLRLEKIFEMIESTPEMHKGESIRGLVADGDAMINLDAPDALRDVMIAGAGRDVEHFEMACYMNLIEQAKDLDLDEAVDLLEMSLQEEIAADEKLAVAFRENLAFLDEEEDEEEDDDEENKEEE